MKTRYLVYYNEGHMGTCPFVIVDESAIVFKNKDKAKQYCKKLNKELAESSHCKVKDLSDHYCITEIGYIK